MKNRPVVTLAGCLALSVLVVFILFALTEDKAAQRYDFARVFPSEFTVREDTAINLKYGSYYIAGATADKIYFGNELVPLHMIESNKELTDTSHIRLQIEDTTLRFKSIHVKVDSPYFFISEGTQPYLLRGKMKEWYASRFMFDSAYFSLAVPVSPTSVVLRARSSSTGEDVLGKLTLHHGKLLPGLLEKQFDGVFCVDGMLHYDKELKEVVYVYYYRNQYVVMDTSLNLLYRGNTIDPISKAQIKADSFSTKETKTYTMSAPALLVNKKSCVYGNWLLVNSALRSKTENEQMIPKTSVIDVYDLKHNTYQFSFYIPNNYGDQLSGIYLFDQKLYAIFRNYVVSYNVHNLFSDKALNMSF